MTPPRQRSRAQSTRAMLLVVLAACGDSPAKPIPVASVTVSPASASLVVGTPQQLTATARDANGVELAGRTTAWSSNNGTVASVSSSGALTTLTSGVAVIQAAIEGAVGSATITVLPVPVATVTVTIPSSTVLVGVVQTAVAVTRDGAGNAITGRAVSWATSSPAIASIDGTGRLFANSPGTVTVSATSESQSGLATLTVQAPAAIITAIAPATLSPGGTATINGSGFDTSLGGVSVTIRGAPAPIVTVTNTQLVVNVPCVESGAADVRVTSLGAASVGRAHPVATTQRTVPIGQALILSSSTASACNELVAIGGPARYLIAVFSAATSPNTVSAFELVGNAPAAGFAQHSTIGAASSNVTDIPAFDEPVSRQERLHFAMLERNRQDYARLMALMRAQPASSRSAQRMRTTADVAVGDMRNVFFTFSAGCNDTTRVIRAKAMRVGTRAIIWEDSANVLQSSADAPLTDFYNRLGLIFDQEQYASVRRSFADPLLRDAVTDNDGKIAMIFSERVNGSGAAAFVTSCDQFPTSISRGSNFGQYFYGSVPTTAGANVGSVLFPDGWFYFMTRTVVHEVKHIASLSARVANAAPAFEQSWLEEGTARHAEEVWVRESMHNVPWRGNTGFGRASNNGMYCDFHPSDATCNAGDPLRRPSYGVRRQFNEIRNKLLEPWDWSPYGNATGQSGSVFYQTAWSLVRYAADRYATSDTSFLQALTNATTNGVTNLTIVAGVSLDQLIGGWGLALFADDYPGLVNASPDIQFATWNLREIYASLNAAPMWTTRWNTPFPIAPVPLTNGPFVAQVPTLRGGAHAYFELTGSFTLPQLLSLRTNATTGPGTNLRMAITRLQ